MSVFYRIRAMAAGVLAFSGVMAVSAALPVPRTVPDSVKVPSAMPDSLVPVSVKPLADIPEWTYESAFLQPDPATDAWWRGFHDPMLDSLISLAVANNGDLRMALRRIEIAGLQVRNAQSRYYPVIGAQAGWTKERMSAFTTSHASVPVTYDYFSLGLTASWEIDVFGRVRRQVDAGKAAWQVSRADYMAAMVSLCAQLAQDYIQLRVCQAELSIAESLSESQQEVLRIATVRHECALASGLDVSQAKTVYFSTRASIPTLRAAIDQYANSIAVLTCIDSPSFLNALKARRPIPGYDMPLQVGIDVQLLRRRPDVVAAEAQIAEYAARIGIAKKDFLPALSLNASVGTASHSLKNIFDHDALTYTIQPTLTWTLFSGFSRKYAVAEAKEQMMLALDSYNLTLQEAAAEVNTALSAYYNSLQRIGMLSEVLAQSMQSLTYSLDQYKQGLSPFLNLVNAQIDVLNYNNQLAEERGIAQQAVINLYKAMGGGWQPLPRNK